LRATAQEKCVFFILNSLQATLITGTIVMFPASYPPTYCTPWFRTGASNKVTGLKNKPSVKVRLQGCTSKTSTCRRRV